MCVREKEKVGIKCVQRMGRNKPKFGREPQTKCIAFAASQKGCKENQTSEVVGKQKLLPFIYMQTHMVGKCYMLRARAAAYLKSYCNRHTCSTSKVRLCSTEQVGALGWPVIYMQACWQLGWCPAVTAAAAAVAIEVLNGWVLEYGNVQLCSS